MDAPVEGQLEGPPVEAPASPSVAGHCGWCWKVGAQDVYSGAHGDAMLSFRIGRGRVVGGLWSQCVLTAMFRSSEVAGLGGIRLAPLTSNGAALSWPSIKSLSRVPPRRAPCPYSFFSPLSLVAQPSIMSGQQCLRRLPCAMRSVPALRAGARAVNRLPAARSYSAISKATSSGLMSQVSRFVLPLIG
jgi:hypothetical protein